MIKIKSTSLILKIYKDGYLHTTIFRKEAHTNKCLHEVMFHPPTPTKNMPFGQFQRLWRICDNDPDFDIKSKETYNRFRESGYPSNVLEPALVRASSLDRHSLPQRKPVTSKKDRVFFATCYSTEAYNIH